MDPPTHPLSPPPPLFEKCTTICFWYFSICDGRVMLGYCEFEVLEVYAIRLQMHIYDCKKGFLIIAQFLYCIFLFTCIPILTRSVEATSKTCSENFFRSLKISSTAQQLRQLTSLIQSIRKLLKKIKRQAK